MPSTRVRFVNSRGLLLSGIIDWPAEQADKFALFAHCFTCTKDLKAIVRVSRSLAKHGIAVLRFDFTGLGDSQGVFAESNFETNCDDILSARNFLTNEHGEPQLLIGHSLGGAAMIATAPQIKSAKAICTLASPSDTYHLADFLIRTNPDIETKGAGDVVIGGRTHTITTQLIESLRRQDMDQHLADLVLPYLVFHSPTDATLSYDHAKSMFEKAGGHTSVITLDDSDHLLVDRADDVGFVADMVAVWSKRYLN